MYKRDNTEKEGKLGSGRLRNCRRKGECRTRPLDLKRIFRGIKQKKEIVKGEGFREVTKRIKNAITE